MKKHVLNVALASLVMSLAPHVVAQMSSPLDNLDINFNETAPREYEYCDQTVNANAPQMVYKACSWGLDDARRMAERFGGGNGKIQGFYRGYAYGVNKMFGAYQNDGVAMKQGAAAVGALGQYMDSGMSEGIRAGQSEGNNDGSSDARARFNSAVDTGMTPDSRLVIRQRAYTAVANAYASLVPADQRVPTTINEIIQKRDTTELDALRVTNFPVVSQYDATTWGEVTPLTLWDLWFDNGTYVFTKERWYDGNLAMKVWMERPIDTKPRYQGLATTVVTDAAGQPINLQAEFAKSFVESYKYYINYYFAKEFKANATLGSEWGESIGIQLGKRVAFGKGLVSAFNDKFNDSARATYQNAYANAYTGGFNTTYADYANNAKLELVALSSGKLVEVIGLDDDGVIQPGEQIKLRFKVKNVGGKGTDLRAVLSGDVLNAATYSSTIAALKSGVYETNIVMGTVDSRLASGSTARLQLSVNGIKANVDQHVTKLVRIASAPSARVEALKGLGTVNVIAKNVSTIQTPASVSAEMVINGQVVATANAGRLAAGQSVSLALNLSDLDPMDLIAGSISGKVILSMGDTELEAADFSMRSANANDDLANYFDQLLNNRGIVPMNMDRLERTDEVSKTVVIENREELNAKRKGMNVWKKDANSTLVGKLVQNKNTKIQSEEAKKAYDRVANEMWKDKKILKKFLFFGAKRNAYKHLLKELTIDGKLD